MSIVIRCCLLVLVLWGCACGTPDCEQKSCAEVAAQLGKQSNGKSFVECYAYASDPISVSVTDPDGNSLIKCSDALKDPCAGALARTKLSYCGIR